MDPEDAAAIFDALKASDPMRDDLVIRDSKGDSFVFRSDVSSFFHEKKNGEVTRLGCGKWTFKLSRSRKTGQASVLCSIEPWYTNDFEIIDFKPDPDENEATIDAFLRKYVFRPYVKKDNVVGVELNFNKEFYVPEEIPTVDEIMKEIKALEDQLKDFTL
jgi:type I restriction enzyme M protein